MLRRICASICCKRPRISSISLVRRTVRVFGRAPLESFLVLRIITARDFTDARSPLDFFDARAFRGFAFTVATLDFPFFFAAMTPPLALNLYFAGRSAHSIKHANCVPDLFQRRRKVL